MLDNIKKFYLKAEKFLLIFLMVFLAITMFLQVVLRYFFHYPLQFGEELARYLQIWITFFGLVYLLRNNSHIRMELFYNKVSNKGKKVINVITNVCVLSALIIIFPGTIDLFKNQVPVKWLGIPWMSMGVTAVAVPISIVMLIAYYAVDTVKSIVGLLQLRKSNYERREI